MPNPMKSYTYVSNCRTRAFSLHTMLRIPFMQEWFTLSGPAMEDAFFDTPLYRNMRQVTTHLERVI